MLIIFSIFNNKKQFANEKCNRIVGKMSVNHPQKSVRIIEIKFANGIFSFTI